MLLDISPKAWHMFVLVVRKAFNESAANWSSPKRDNSYSIAKISNNEIVIEVHHGQNKSLRQRAFLNFLRHLNSNGGVYHRKDYKSHVSKMACIVHFHPSLEWVNNNNTMKIVTAPLSGLASYEDFGSPPDDDPIQLQLFARKVRRGQSAFRQQLMIRYGSHCCVSGTGVEHVLDACHIEPHAKRGINKLENGLLLRADIHNLFDSNLLFIEPETYKIHLHPKLLKTDYWQYNEKVINTIRNKPGNDFLQLRWEEKNW